MEAEQSASRSDRRLSVRRRSLSPGRGAGRRQHMPLPHVPEGRRRAVHGVRTAVPMTDFVVTRGAIATFASSDIAERGFCSACGTPLTYRGVKSAAHQRDDLQPRRARTRSRPSSNSASESQVHWLAERARAARDANRRMAGAQENRGDRQPPASRPRDSEFRPRRLTMTEALIYDHVRTPRGRGKPDGSLHTATTLHLAATALKAIKDRNHLDSGEVDDVVMGCVDAVGEAGGDIARMGALAAGFGDGVPGRADQSLLRFGARQRQFRRRAGDGRPARHDDRRRRRIDEPRRHRRGGRRLAGRSRARDSRLFHAAGHLGGPDRDQVWLLARRRRRLCRAVAKARRRRLAGRPLQEFARPGARRQWTEPARSRRAHAAQRPTCNRSRA